jgi:hypothetical protein
MKEWDHIGSYGDWLGECSVDPVGTGLWSVASSCKYGDEPSGSGEKELVTLYCRGSQTLIASAPLKCFMNFTPPLTEKIKINRSDRVKLMNNIFF